MLLNGQFSFLQNILCLTEEIKSYTFAWYVICGIPKTIYFRFGEMTLVEIFMTFKKKKKKKYTEIILFFRCLLLDNC